MEYILEDQIGYILRRANQRHTAIFQNLIGTVQLTPTQFAVLARLDEVKEASQNELGRLTAMDPATTQGVIKRLLDRDMITRRSLAADRRRKILCISSYGKRIIKRAYESAHLITKRTLEPLESEERETLLRLLSKML